MKKNVITLAQAYICIAIVGTLPLASHNARANTEETGASSSNTSPIANTNYTPNEAATFTGQINVDFDRVAPLTSAETVTISSSVGYMPDGQTDKYVSEASGIGGQVSWAIGDSSVKHYVSGTITGNGNVSGTLGKYDDGAQALFNTTIGITSVTLEGAIFHVRSS